MGWYGTPDDEIKHFDITKETIRETKERWRENAEAKGDASEHQEDRLDQSGNLGAEERVRNDMGADRRDGRNVTGGLTQADRAEADGEVAGVHIEKGVPSAGHSARHL